MIQWHKGAPPKIGWWPASIRYDPRAIRWWDGECWSFSVTPDYNEELAEIYAKKPANFSDGDILWTKRWWK